MTQGSAFPKAALAQHMAVLGKAGSGKSYAVRGLIEGLLDDNARVCIVDPTGAWHGLRSSATGKSAGYPVVIFGGDHADLPLGRDHGEAIAEVIGTSSSPSILDTSLMKVSERTRFFADFGDALMRKNKGPIHLVIDEAHLFMPQGKVASPQAGEMLAAGNNMVSGGRSRGLRIIMITQRPAKLHKDSLTQAETLVAMKLIAPQDRGAVEAWIEDNAEEAKTREVISSLAGLKVGTGWVWAPALGILEKVTFPRIKTFDSGRAPDGSEGEAAKVLAPIDREAMAAKLKAVAVDVVANDPKTLRARIAELERAAKATKPVTPDVDEKAIEQRGYDLGLAQGRTEVAILMEREASALINAGDKMFATASQLKNARPENPNADSKRTVPSESPRKPEATLAVTRAPSSLNAKLSKAARKILDVLANFPDGCMMGKLTLLTGYRASGGFKNALGELRTNGCIEGSNIQTMRITPEGGSYGPFEPLPVGDDLLRYWLTHPSFGKAARSILEVLSDGDSRTAKEISAATGYEISGGFKNALGELRTAGAIVGRNTEAMRISPEIVP